MKNDPFEENNIAKEQPEIVKNLEGILQDFLSIEKKIDRFEISDDEDQKISDELKAKVKEDIAWIPTIGSILVAKERLERRNVKST